MIRNKLTFITIALALSGALVAIPMTESASASPAANVKLLTCTGTTVVKPSTFVITCADANILLTKTHWSTWTGTSASGTTRFGMNLCKPYCAASPITYFSNSSVRLSSPEVTKHGKLFSSLIVRYRAKGKLKSYRFTWRGDPSF
jgi:hypothetical protein